MAWMTLADALEGALASMLNGNQAGVDAPVDAFEFERTGANVTPAKWCQGDTALPVQEVDASRSIATAPPTRSPTSAVVIDLAVHRAERRHAATASRFARA